MNGELQVFSKTRGAKGHGRACIVGVRKGSSEAMALEAWLAERIDVLRFEQHIGTGAFYVDYDDGTALPGRFIRSLRDKIHTLNRPTPEPFDVIPVHRMKGRVRLRVTGIGEQELATLTMLASGLPGVQSTKHIRGGRTMLVNYNAEKVSVRFIVAGLLKSDPSEWAREWHEPTPTRWLAALSGTSTLIACLGGVAPFPWLAVAVMLNTVRPLGRSIAALREGEISIDLLDVAATLAALATGRSITAAFVIWMVGIGDLLLDISANNARSALSMLMRRKEPEALRVLAGWPHRNGAGRRSPGRGSFRRPHRAQHRSPTALSFRAWRRWTRRLSPASRACSRRRRAIRCSLPRSWSRANWSSRWIVPARIPRPRRSRNSEHGRIETAHVAARRARHCEQAGSSDVRGRRARCRSVRRRDPRRVRAHHRLRNRLSHRGADDRADRDDAGGARRSAGQRRSVPRATRRRPTSSFSTRPVRSPAACRKWSRW